jgi:hypothetical protein
MGQEMVPEVPGRVLLHAVPKFLAKVLAWFGDGVGDGDCSSRRFLESVRDGRLELSEWGDCREMRVGLLKRVKRLVLSL